MLEFTEVFWIASIVKVIALFLGAFIVYLAYKGYRRNASKPLLYVALGFGLITAGTFLEGLMFVMLGSDILEAVATGTVLTAVGFVAIIYSVYAVK
ncbi:MAG: hypothetical protein WB661_10130 [Candidatus Bathyarchaeia archaeon]